VFGCVVTFWVSDCVVRCVVTFWVSSCVVGCVVVTFRVSDRVARYVVVTFWVSSCVVGCVVVTFWVSSCVVVLLHSKAPSQCLHKQYLRGTVHSRTRIPNGTIAALDNTFINKTRNRIISPRINGTPDYDAQVITLNNIFFLQKPVDYEAQAISIVPL